MAQASSAAGFGKNQVFTKTFDWQLCDTGHFTVYYYPQIKKDIPEISRMLEKSYSEVTDFLGVALKKKPNYFFFGSHPDFHSNRVAPVGWGTGGFSEPYKNRFFMPFYTSPEEMRHVLQHEFTHIASFEIFYGGFWRSLSLVRLMVYPIPLWMQEGLAEFCSDTWDAEDASAMRDIYYNNLIVPTEDLLSFSHLEGYRVYLAYKQSQKMLMFLAREFGREKVVELIRQFPQVWEQNVAMKKVINIDTKEFDSRFRKYLKDACIKGNEKRISPGKLGLRVSPDYSFYWARSPLFTGDTLSYVYDGMGYDDIIVYDLKNKKEKFLLKSRKDYFDRVGDGRAVSGGAVIFNAWKNEKMYLAFMKGGKMTLKKLPFTDVRKIAVVPGGGLLMCADLDSQSDIFLWDDGRIKNLTSDKAYEESFSADLAHQKIIYSCERNNELDLRQINLAGGGKTWLTDTAYDEKKPLVKNGRLYFMSEKGSFSDVYGTFISSPDFNGARNLTYIKTGITDYDVSDGGKVAAVAQWNGARQVYLFDGNKSTASAGEYSPDPDFLRRGIDIKDRKKIAAATHPSDDAGYAVAGVNGESYPARISPAVSVPENVQATNFRRYKTRWSFDLVYPLAMFVVSEGNAEFYLLNYFQASDMTGRHNANLYLQWLSSTGDLSYSASYLYRKWKTHVGFFAEGYRQTSWRYGEDGGDILTEDYRINDGGLVLSRPLNTQRRLELMLAKQVKTDEVPSGSLLPDYGRLDKKDENSLTLSFIDDTSIQRFMDIVRGQRFNLSIVKSRGNFDSKNINYSTASAAGNVNYMSLYYEQQFFVPVWFPEQVFAFRILGLFSWGMEPEVFDITRWDRVRGLIEAPDASRLAMVSAEYRFYFFRNIDYNLWWLIPPMYFKSLKGVLFCDAGENFNTREEFRNDSLHRSVGFGLRLATLLFQSYPMTISFDRAKALKEKNYESYLKIGINW